MDAPRIIIEIRGGMCISVYSNTDVSVSVLDYDNMGQAQCEEDQTEYEDYKELIKELSSDTYKCVW